MSAADPGPRFPVEGKLSPAQVKGLAWCSLPVGLQRVYKRADTPSDPTLQVLYDRKLITRPSAIGELTEAGRRKIAELKRKAATEGTTR